MRNELDSNIVQANKRLHLFAGAVVDWHRSVAHHNEQFQCRPENYAYWLAYGQRLRRLRGQAYCILRTRLERRVVRKSYE